MREKEIAYYVGFRSLRARSIRAEKRPANACRASGAAGGTADSIV